MAEEVKLHFHLASIQALSLSPFVGAYMDLPQSMPSHAQNFPVNNSWVGEHLNEWMAACENTNPNRSHRDKEKQHGGA